MLMPASAYVDEGLGQLFTRSVILNNDLVLKRGRGDKLALSCLEPGGLYSQKFLLSFKADHDSFQDRVLVLKNHFLFSWSFCLDIAVDCN